MYCAEVIYGIGGRFKVIKDRYKDLKFYLETKENYVNHKALPDM